MGYVVSEQPAMWWVAHKILLSPPVPWIGDLGIGDWGLDWGLTIGEKSTVFLCCYHWNEMSNKLKL